jgi:hypothetical protein
VHLQRERNKVAPETYIRVGEVIHLVVDTGVWSGPCRGHRKY